ncbi:hypothetical protein C1H46_036291 [Malus baccata]|uniref:Uncharacterized protein n=1 Tax=Malus baccata TaxID=106549 RepID=A0A540KVY2_MALBA|nr:hypothetical protein C1H46_036291 [Malus baccata]
MDPTEFVKEQPHQKCFKFQLTMSTEIELIFTEIHSNGFVPSNFNNSSKKFTEMASCPQVSSN